MKLNLNNDVFLSYIGERGYSIRSLGSAIGVNERCLRRYVKEGRIGFETAIALSKFFEARFEDFLGPDTSDDYMTLRWAIGGF